MSKLYLTQRNIDGCDNQYASYYELVHHLFDDMILCNNIPDVDPSIYDNIITGEFYDDEYDEYIDIYQFFIVSLRFNEEDIQVLNDNNDLILFYSDLLDVYILGVSHFGTPWRGVNTGVEVTNDFDEYLKQFNY